VPDLLRRPDDERGEDVPRTLSVDKTNMPLFESVNIRVKYHPEHSSTLLSLLYRGDIDSGGRRGEDWDN
jgi:hypothetical protein